MPNSEPAHFSNWTFNSKSSCTVPLHETEFVEFDSSEQINLELDFNELLQPTLGPPLLTCMPRSVSAPTSQPTSSHVQSNEATASSPNKLDDFQLIAPYLPVSDSEHISIGDPLNPSVDPSKQGSCSVNAGLQMNMSCPTHISESCRLHTH